VTCARRFATPQIITVDGAPLLISMGAKATYAYDPLTAKSDGAWEERTNHSCKHPAGVRVRPGVPANRFSEGELLAVRPDGRGDITATHSPGR
jgi:hypothetical protein